LLDRKPENLTKMVKPSLDNVRSLLGGKATSWGLVDWIYMSPTAVPRVYEAYKDVADSNVAVLLDNLGASWRATAGNLLSSQYNLWWRDSSYKTAKTPNGSPVFWSGGNAWGIAGLARVMEYMPASHKDMPYYLKQFQDSCKALRECPGLGKDGMWRTSLLDYNQYPQQDSISSAFFGYCFAFGINRGYLDRATYEPFVRNTWSSLVKNIATDGRLQWCQQVTEKPTSVSQNNSAPEGEGAFMLMAEELVKMLGGGGGGLDGGSSVDTGPGGAGGGSGGTTSSDGGKSSGGGASGTGGAGAGGTTGSSGGGGGGAGTAGVGGSASGGTSGTTGPGGSSGGTSVVTQPGDTGCSCLVGGHDRGVRWGATLAIGAVLGGQLARLLARRQRVREEGEHVDVKEAATADKSDE
jgi:hypothetical protein